MEIFYLFFFLLVLQRLFELFLARQNEKWMKERGAVEFGQWHYLLIVAVHVLFFAFYFLEVVLGDKGLSPAWPFLLLLFFFAQLMRIWIISSLGKHWNTKIIVLPGSPLVKKGPYRFFKHPNYAVVAVEFIVIPLLFQAYVTAVLFSLLNLAVLAVRIPAEEEALGMEREPSLLRRGLAGKFLNKER